MKFTHVLPVFLLALLLNPAFAEVDAARRADAQAAVDRGIAFLRTTQQDDGAWTPKPGPAITAMALTGMLQHPDIDMADPNAARALAYILAAAKPDGGIYDQILPNYNTAISISALAHCRNAPGVEAVYQRAIAFEKGLQWADGDVTPDGHQIARDHPFYGGAGYGHHGRPDMSNTQTMVQAMRDAGIDSDDPVYARAMVFITRCQGTASNDMYGDRIAPDGGFIYATSQGKDQVGVLESKAGEETLTIDGQPVTRLRTYGSMTYAGFKSYIYADLSRSDPRVIDAWNWIRSNYTLDHNPGLPEPRQMQGYYYYLLTFSRALRAWGSDTIPTPDGDRNWRSDLIDALVERQNADGSWINEADRWLEGDPNLVTAYSVIALQSALQ